MPPDVSALAALRHQPERHVAGTVDHYVKSNLDGSYPARVALYLAGPDTLEVLKLEAHNADAVHITAHLDWRTFSMDRAESWIILPDGQRHLQAEVAFDTSANKVALSVRGRHDVVALNRYPAHIYNFDLISLTSGESSTCSAASAQQITVCLTPR